MDKLGSSTLFVTIAVIILGVVTAEEDNTFACHGVACKSVPDTCNTIQCKLGVRFEMTQMGDTTVDVHSGAVATSKDNYVAIGFSKDGNMGEDVVIMCIPTGNNDSVSTMKNPGGHSPPVPVKFVSGTPSGKTLYKNGRVDCSFILPVEFDAGDGLSFNLMKDEVNIFVATGPVSNGAPQHHTEKVMGMLTGEDLSGTSGSGVNGNAAMTTGMIQLTLISSFLLSAVAFMH